MIFLSYRRDDTAAISGRIYDRLEARFGRGNVFMDFDSIPIGADFRTQIVTSLATCRVFIAVMGPDWLALQPDGRRRIDDPRDFVRIEVATALQRGLPLVPVLVEGAVMPEVSQLPDELKDLAFRNGLRVDAGVDFRHHVERLLVGVQSIVDRTLADEKAAVAVVEKPPADVAPVPLATPTANELAIPAAKQSTESAPLLARVFPRRFELPGASVGNVEEKSSRAARNIQIAGMNCASCGAKLIWHDDGAAFGDKIFCNKCIALLKSGGR